ncbi:MULTISPECIES: hypothetical protein [Bacillus]|uniref:hypothetical protein n=1 Tax=Bacillus TaxID=1386 RepID=UPI001C21E824|nr:hypothetical protein [Bacillus pumilus]MBU8577172.1 hypothetical protein [Bacillus pumilus]
MDLFVITMLIYLFFFSLFFFFMYRGEKREAEENKTNEGYVFSTFVGALLLSLIPTAVIMFIVLIATGSISVIVKSLGLNVDFTQIIIVSLALVCYSFTLDNIFITVAKHIMGDNILKTIFVSLFRFLFVFFVGVICSIGIADSIKISIGLTLVCFLLEFISTDRPKA